MIGSSSGPNFSRCPPARVCWPPEEVTLLAAVVGSMDRSKRKGASMDRQREARPVDSSNGHPSANVCSGNVLGHRHPELYSPKDLELRSALCPSRSFAEYDSTELVEVRSG